MFKFGIPEKGYIVLTGKLFLNISKKANISRTVSNLIAWEL